MDGLDNGHIKIRGIDRSIENKNIEKRERIF